MPKVLNQPTIQWTGIAAAIAAGVGGSGYNLHILSVINDNMLKIRSDISTLQADAAKLGVKIDTETEDRFYGRDGEIMVGKLALINGRVTHLIMRVDELKAELGTLRIDHKNDITKLEHSHPPPSVEKVLDDLETRVRTIERRQP